MMLKKLALAVVLLVAPALLIAQTQGLGAPTFPAPAIGASAVLLHTTMADYWEWKLAYFPETATSIGRDEYNDRWRDWSAAGRATIRRDQEEFLSTTIYAGAGNLTAVDRLSEQLLQYELDMALSSATWVELTSQTSQAQGAHNRVLTVIDQMPARDVKDYENILARLRKLPVYVDQTIELMREQLAAGLAQPQIVIDLTLEQVVAQSRPPALESPLLAAFSRFPSAVSSPDQDRLRRQAVAAYEQQFVPSWKTLETFLRDTYRPRARPQIGLSSLPNGAEGYATLIRYYTSTQLSAQAIHEIGLREVERISREMEQLARADGFTGPVADYERQLASRPGMTFTSKDEMIAYAREVAARVEPELPRLFRLRPRMKYDIRPIPPDREASSASNYGVGTADGSRPAWFNMNTYRPEEQVKYRTEALVLHETVPGHHLQVALERELEGLPEFRRVFDASAFSEGWGLYAESLGAELGTVYREPSTKFGQLASEMFRAVRLVVDTGIHSLGWSRDQARTYFSTHVPSQSLAEVDRYIARPAQALGYKLGELRIRELRRRAEQALGPRFDIRSFHDAVLKNGRIPLDRLDLEVTSYISAAQVAR
jgi:prolyl oligopeptidase